MLTILTLLQYITCPHDLRGMVLVLQLGEMVAKQDTTLRHGVSTSGCVTAPEIFDETLGHFPAAFVATEPEEPKHHLFLTPTECFA